MNFIEHNETEKQEYCKPEIEIIEVELEGVIAASSGGVTANGNDLLWRD